MTANRRHIQRAAFLHDAQGRPGELLHLLPEIARKGYAAVEVAALRSDTGDLAKLCRRAAALKLEVWLLTGYMKYDEAWLARHPDQRLVSAEDVRDQDGLSTSSWGCPFQPQFKARYFSFLRKLAALPGVARISLNDEAFLQSGCYCRTCRADYHREIGGEMPLKPEPKIEDWKDATWRTYLRWKMERWNRVHGEMAAVVHRANPRVKATFQASPACDLWLNPWSTAVDLSGMIEHLDGLSTDPYYTFHERHFHPAEVYLGEWCRFLHGIVPKTKVAEMIPQGFSHPTFTRPLGREDGYWSALIPPACGVRRISPYCYHFQKASPAQETYEACFQLDRWFEKVEPIQYAAIIHGAQTETFARPLPQEVPASYDGTRLMPVADALRHKGIPYAFLPDRRLDDLAAFRVVVLPEINCLSTDQASALRQYLDGGGNAVILGNLGSADETGAPHKRSSLEEWFGIRIRSESPAQRSFRLTSKHPAARGLERVDTTAARRYMGGACMPFFALRHCVDADVPRAADVLARFEDCDRPAIVSLRGRGRVIWLAGFPTRVAENAAFRTRAPNRAHSLFPLLVEWAAGAKPALRVENWPPDVPMRRLRPFDHRFMPTFEFFPLAGEDGFLGLVTSYFKEPARFPMALDIPRGRRLKKVTELIGQRKVPFQHSRGVARIAVELDFDTPARLYWFDLD